jgi:mRNA interferase MazF
MVVNRGEIWWTVLAPPRGSGPGFRRPVLVVQADSFNRSRISTVLGATITSNIERAEAPGNVAMSRRESGLPKKSVVNVSQLVTVDRGLFKRRVKALPARVMARVDRGLMLALGL